MQLTLNVYITQGTCGASWAWGTTEQIESDAIRAGLLQCKDSNKLSSQKLLSCVDTVSYISQYSLPHIFTWCHYIKRIENRLRGWQLRVACIRVGHGGREALDGLPGRLPVHQHRGRGDGQQHGGMLAPGSHSSGMNDCLFPAIILSLVIKSHAPFCSDRSNWVRNYCIRGRHGDICALHGPSGCVRGRP